MMFGVITCVGCVDYVQVAVTVMVNCLTLNSIMYSNPKLRIGMTFHTGFQENVNQGNDIIS
jgi:hypothetical protein